MRGGSGDAGPAPLFVRVGRPGVGTRGRGSHEAALRRSECGVGAVSWTAGSGDLALGRDR